MSRSPTVPAPHTRPPPGRRGTRVFVYGSLMAGQPHHALLSGARRLGACRLPLGRLYDLGAYPALRPGAGAVSGEVYVVDRATLRRLDRLEDHPRTYRRRRVATPWGPAWVYLYRRPLPAARRLRTGDWNRHRRPAQNGSSPWSRRRWRRTRD